MPPKLISKERKLFVDNTPLVNSFEEDTTLSADAASGAGTITVQNINKFAINKILIVGELGDEQSEIVKTHASSAPSGSTVTLAANLVFAHPTGTRVRIISYDQIELSHATTAAGSKTTLTTTIGTGLVALEADDRLETYLESEYSTGYYFARYKNTITAAFGDYSDAVPYGGFAKYQIGYMIDYSLKRSRAMTFTSDINDQFCFDEVNDCLQTMQGKLRRMNRYQTLNASIGTTTRGTNVVAMPSDIYDKYSKRSLSALRIGKGQNLDYLDPEEYERFINDMTVTTNTVLTAIAATSLVLTSANDFEDSGTANMFVAGVLQSITYTGVTRATNTLTGIPASGAGSITVAIPAATNIYQSYHEGEPRVYTVRNGNIEFAPLPSDLFDNQNIWADYWREALYVDSEGDTLDAERYDIVKNWLTWKMRAIHKNNGKLDLEDGDYLRYKEGLSDLIRTMGPLFKKKMMPRINGIRYSSSRFRHRLINDDTTT